MADAIDNAGSGSVPSSSSAGGSSTPASSPAGPSSAAAALESASSAASTGQPGGNGQPSPASTGPATSASGATVPTSQPSGEAPEHRIEAAVRNVRRELTERLGWAERYKPEEVEEATSMLAALNSDPRGFLNRLQAELEDDDPADPEPDLQSDDGKKKAYSHEAMRKIIANVERRITRSLEGRFGPALEFANEGRAAQAVSAQVAEGRSIATQALTEARKLPHFKDNEPAISEKLAAMDPTYRRRVGSVAALYMAYNAVLSEKVLPTLKITAEQDAISGFQKSAHASSGQVQPGTGVTGKPVLKEGDIDGLARHMAKLAGAAR